MLVQLSKGFHIADPLIYATDSVTDQIRQAWVAAMEPAAWSYTISLVLDLARVKVIKLLEDRSLEQLSVESSDTVYGVRADNRQESHSHLLVVTFLNQTHSRELVRISRISLLHSLEEVVVDFINELHVAGQQLLDESYRPLLEGFR